jgi:hypothetical protein
MAQVGTKSNRKRLSRRATWRIKFIIIPVISAIVLTLYISFVTSLWGEPEAIAFGSLIALAILFLLFMMTMRIRFIEYDDQFVYVKNYGKERTFPLHTVQAVNLPYWNSKTRDRTYQLEIVQAGRTSKFGFLPIESDHSIWGRPEDPESIKEFMLIVRHFKESARA